MPRRFAGRLAFVTDDVFQPGGGIAAADALCQREASAAGLPGTYCAELATSTGPAEARFDLSGPDSPANRHSAENHVVGNSTVVIANAIDKVRFGRDIPLTLSYAKHLASF